MHLHWDIWTDKSCSSFTMLFQDECGGLELEDPRNRGTYLSAKPMEGAMLLNIGDMFMHFTNGKDEILLVYITIVDFLLPSPARYSDESLISWQTTSYPQLIA